MLTHGSENPESPLPHSDEAFQYYLMALVKSGHNASVAPAVQRREQLMRAHPLPSTTETDDLVAGNSEQAQARPASETESVSSSSAATQEMSSRSQEIAKMVLSSEAKVLSTPRLSTTSSTGAAPAVKATPLSAGSGTGGPDSPIYVTIAERMSSCFLSCFYLADPNAQHAGNSGERLLSPLDLSRWADFVRRY